MTTKAIFKNQDGILLSIVLLRCDSCGEECETHADKGDNIVGAEIMALEIYNYAEIYKGNDGATICPTCFDKLGLGKLFKGDKDD